MSLHSTLLQYFLLKEAKGEKIKLPGLPTFVSHKCYGGDRNELGNVVYVDIVSLPADSKDTIMKILRKLYTIFVLEMKNKWLIVVGDAKT